MGGANITSLGLAGYTAAYSVVAGSLDVTFTATSAPAAYFNGAGNDLNTAGNYDTSVSSGVANTVAPSSTTNVFFSANENGLTSATLSAPLAVNSVNFGTGTGTKSGITVSGTGTLTINGTTANGNAANNGITIATGGGSDAISAAVALGGSQTWTPTDASSTLTVSGQVSGAGFALTKAGAGTVILSNATGNTYSGGTAVTAGRLLVTNTSGSGTGTGAVSVTGSSAILGGSGKIGGAVTVKLGRHALLRCDGERR